MISDAFWSLKIIWIHMIVFNLFHRKRKKRQLLMHRKYNFIVLRISLYFLIDHQRQVDWPNRMIVNYNIIWKIAIRIPFVFGWGSSYCPRFSTTFALWLILCVNEADKDGTWEWSWVTLWATSLNHKQCFYGYSAIIHEHFPYFWSHKIDQSKCE